MCQLASEIFLYTIPSPMMQSLANEQILEILYDSDRTQVYRCQRQSQTVIIKLLKQDKPSLTDLAHFRNHYNLTHNIDIPGIVKPLSLESTTHGNLVLVMADEGLVSLKDYQQTLPNHRLSLADFFPIALQLAQILTDLYQRHIIHKDIKPANILIQPETRLVKLTDFSLASVLSWETQATQHPNTLEGTLAYIAPEQTGRMNRSVDYRSDFYSLGVTFYELLTGTLPFATFDPMEMVHCHIAQPPTPPHQLVSDIPVSLSKVVQKLLAKNPEDRYQSAQGLQYDLELCQQQLEQGEAQTFNLGTQDRCDRFVIPEKLYGREAEVATLLSAFERVASSAPLGHLLTHQAPSQPVQNHSAPQPSQAELLLVAGHSGIGKTVVVNEVHKPILRQHGYFIQGKFDQFRRNVPFSAFIQALRAFVTQLLAESEDALERWQLNLSQALGNNAQVLIDAIPELEKVVGPQPQVPELSAEAAQNRFNRVFSQFIQASATPQNPLVIFLDDLQWIDSASLQLIQLLLTEIPDIHLLLIGAYRNNEVPPSHPLTMLIRDLQQTNITINTLTLQALPQAALNALIADTLRCSQEAAAPLAELTFNKTGGNPFFSRQFLQSLHQDRLIWLDLQSHRWQCDITPIKSATISSDVVAFMITQLQKLAPSTQTILQLAACLGNQFDLSTLSDITQQSAAQAAADLWPALEGGFILPLNEVYKFYQGHSSEETAPESITVENCTYKFLHDRVQQAAYELVLPERRLAIHLQIGQILRSTIPPDRLSEHIYELVGHLNLGAALLTSTKDQEELAQFNQLASQQALATYAYAAAVDYGTTGINLLSAHHWTTHLELMLSLHECVAEAAYLNGNFQQSEQVIDTILQQPHSLLLQIKAYEIQIEAYKAQNRGEEAILTGLKVLRRLGVTLRHQPTQGQIILSMAKTKIRLLGQSSNDLSHLPAMEDPKILAAFRIMEKLSSIAYISNPRLFALIVLKQIRLLQRYGNCSFAALAYLLYGIALWNIFNDIEAAYQLGQLALHLAETFNITVERGKVNFVANFLTKAWKIHLRDTLQPLKLNYSACLEVGDLDHAAYSLYGYAKHSFWASRELSRLNQEMANHHQAITQLNQEVQQDLLDIYWQTVTNLVSDDAIPLLQGEIYDQRQKLPLHHQAGTKTAVCILHTNQLFLSYLFSNYDLAADQAEQAQVHLEAIVATIGYAQFCFYHALLLLTTYPEQPEDQQQAYLKQTDIYCKKISTWANFAPMNFLHKQHLLAAEKSRILGARAAAMEAYELAIQFAQKHEYLQDAALANERAALFYQEWGKDKIAQVYLVEAYYCYTRWGAIAKVRALESRYPQWLPPGPRRSSQSLQGTTTHSSLHQASVDALDWLTITKASQVLTENVQLNKLLIKMMQVIQENAGAEAGALLLFKEDQLQCKVYCMEGNVSSWDDTVLAVPYAKSVVQYVRHTQETIVLDAVKADARFMADSYIHDYQPQSLLCMPIQYRDQMLGLLYLEHRQTPGVFSAERLQVLKILIAQAAISLQNALFYESLSEQVEDQTQQLRIESRERQLALGALQESEEKFSKAFHANPDPMVLTTDAGKYIEANSSFLTFFDLSQADIDAQTCLNWQVWQASGTTVSLHEMVQEQHELHDQEVQLCDLEDDLRTVLVSTERLTLQEEPVILFTIKDITALKQTEATLSRSNAILEAQRAATMDGVLVVDEHQQLLYCNQQFQHLWSIPDHELAARPSDPSLVEYVRSQVMRPEEFQAKIQYLVTHPQITSEDEVALRDGRTIERISCPVQSETGHYYGRIWSFRDITERKQREKVLKQQLQRASLLGQITQAINQSLDPQTILQTATTQLGQIFGVCRCLIYTSIQAADAGPPMVTEFVGGSWSSIRDVEFPHSGPPFIEQIIAQDQAIISRDVQTDLRLEPLQEILTTINARSIMAIRTSYNNVLNGAIVLFQCDRIRDWTSSEIDLLEAVAAQLGIAIAQARLLVQETQQRRQLEEAKQRAEAANQAKSEFLAHMSHELRTPLNAILGFSQLMQRSDATTPEQQENLTIINRSGEHLLGLINDILEMSKIEAGRTVATPTDFDLYGLLTALDAMLQIKAKAKGLHLQVEHPATLPQYVHADEGKLRQILINLLGNAIKFTDAGQVILRVAPQPSSTQDITHLIFEVEDSGHGIAEHEMEALFKPFTQTESGRNSHEGTGLGLTISQTFVQLMGGNLSVASQLHQGTTVTFDLPIQVVGQIQTVPTSSEQVIGLVPHQPQYRILVVDDTWESRHLMVQLLECVGFQVRQAEDGQVAIQQWQTWHPHLIWMDLQMPDVNGYEAVQQIRAAQQEQPIIIALTANAFQETRAQALQVGCDDFMRKPFQTHEIFEMMARHLEIRYLYQAQSNLPSTAVPEPLQGSKLTPEAFSSLPPDLRHQLQEAAIRLDEQQMLQLTTQIQDPDLRATVEHLVETFQFDQLAQLTA